MTNISDNIGIFIKKQGISVRALEQAIGCSNGVISRCISKGTDISSQWVSKIIEIYPQLNPTWLLLGEGNMLRHGVENDFYDQEVHQNIETAIETRPRIPYEAAAGTLSIAINPVHHNDCEHIPVIPTFPRYDFTIITRGDSMWPDFHSGDELACALVKESSFIQWGRVHVLDTAQGIVLKKIFDGKKNIVCKSINKEYPDFEVPKDEIYHIAVVVGLIRHF